MSGKSIGLSDELHAYVMGVGVREPAILSRLREETQAMPQSNMQIAPEEGAFLSLIVELTGARRCLELGTFTGYSSLAVALALPAGGTLLCCDVSEEWTGVARRYWTEAGVTDRIELRIGPAIDTLDGILADGGESSYDLAFVDADKVSYPAYYDRLIRLVRPGGLMLWDNVFMGGKVLDDTDDTDTDTDEGVRAVRQLNARLAGDDRVNVCMLPLADGVTMVRRRT